MTRRQWLLSLRSSRFREYDPQSLPQKNKAGAPLLLPSGAPVLFCVTAQDVPSSAEMASAARCAGCELTNLVEHGTQRATRINCPSSRAAAKLVELLSALDAREPWVRQFAHKFRGPDAPRNLQRWVQDNVKFIREPGEVFQAPWVTVALGSGDCDDHSRLIGATLLALGYRVAFCYLLTTGQPRHVWPAFWDDRENAWISLETTVAAQYGEDPLEAVKRLDVKRADIAQIGSVTTAPDQHPNYRAPQRTALSEAGLVKLFAGATRAVGEVFAAPALALLVAQVAHETANGAQVWNWNFGGQKASVSQVHTYLRTRELLDPDTAAKWIAKSSPAAPVEREADVNGKVMVIVRAFHPSSRFRAYDSAADGAAGHVRLLRDRFGAAWSTLRTGDATAFVRALKDRGYFTGDLAQYIASVKAKQNQFATLVGKVGTGIAAVGIVMSLAGAAGAGIALANMKG